MSASLTETAAEDAAAAARATRNAGGQTSGVVDDMVAAIGPAERQALIDTLNALDRNVQTLTRSLTLLTENMDSAARAAANSEAGGIVAAANRTLNSGKAASSIQAPKNPVTETAADDADAAAQAAAGTDRVTVRVNQANSKFGWAKAAFFMGIPLAGYCIYSLILFETTDGAVINITNIKRINSTQIQVSYTLASYGPRAPQPPLSTSFSLSANDTLDFSGCQGAECIGLGNGEKIVAVIDDSNVIVQANENLSLASYSPSSPTTSGLGAPVSSPGGSGSWGTATVHTSFGNQLASSVQGTATLIIGATAGVLIATLNNLTPVLNTAGHVAGTAFCDIVPFLCDSTVLWAIGGICLCIIVLVVVSFVLKKK